MRSDEPAERGGAEERKVDAARRTDSWTTPLYRATKILGELRDGLLVLAAFLYAVGYGVWATHALKSGIGPLPVLDFQYLVAGGPPFLLLLVAELYVRNIGGLGLSAARRLPGFDFKAARKFVLIGLGGPMFLLLCMDFSEAIPSPYARYVHLFVPVTLVIADFAFLVAYLNDSRDPHRAEPLPDTNTIPRPRFDVRLRVWTVALGLVWSYAVVFYPMMPQSLGGALPRCANIDVDESRLAPGTAAALGIVSAKGRPGVIVQSRKMDLLFEGREVLVVRPRLSGENRQSQESSAVELNRDIVTAIDWCD